MTRRQAFWAELGWWLALIALAVVCAFLVQPKPKPIPEQIPADCIAWAEVYPGGPRYCGGYADAE